MSHELRTPLNSMLILSRLLAENEERSLTDREVEFARTIHSAGNDLLSLINDILDLSKVEAGRMELDLAPVALSDVYQDAERAFRHVAEQKGLSFAGRDRPGAAGGRSSPTSSASGRCSRTSCRTRSSSPTRAG